MENSSRRSVKVLTVDNYGVLVGDCCRNNARENDLSACSLRLSFSLASKGSHAVGVRMRRFSLTAAPFALAVRHRPDGFSGSRGFPIPGSSHGSPGLVYRMAPLHHTLPIPGRVLPALAGLIFLGVMRD
jgi:hypothetical protein